MDLNITWFFLIGVLVAGYAILDGFDLGVGVLHLFSKSKKEKSIYVNAIGPVWDGNEVWLLTAGGALFAAFPIVYAQVFSGFYTGFMLLLFALIARAVSLELGHQLNSPKWNKVWDLCFGIGSFVPALLLGLVVGNILKGLPIAEDGSLHISFFSLLNPYSLVVGITGLVMFTMHGAMYMTLKTDGEFRDKIEGWVNRTWMIFVLLYFAITVWTYFGSSFLFAGIFGRPLIWVFLVLMVGSLIYIPIAVKGKKYLLGFISSSVTILSLVGLVAVSAFPVLVPSSINLDYSFTIYNAASTPKTLLTMLIITLIGMPIVLAYTFYLYRVFRGKTEVDDHHSY